mgnify:FL=1
MKVAVSYLKSTLSAEKTIEKITETSADYIHVDLMDGLFVPKKNDDLEYHINLLQNQTKPLDIHLMMIDPIGSIKKLQILQPTTITVHLEIPKLKESLELLDTLKIGKGIAVNPETDIEKITPYLKEINEVLLMSVHPGAGGQTFMPSVVPKITWLKNYRKTHNLQFTIAVDGGINDQTISAIKDVDLVISGSFICESDDYEQQITKLRQQKNC